METATQTLHRLTSYTPGHRWDQPVDDPRMVQDLRTNDMDRFPWFFKRYPHGLPRQALPRELPATTEPALAVLAGTAEVAPGRLDLAQLSRLLYLSAGVVRISPRPFGNWLFRAAGSAGGRFPLELYVAVPQGGVHRVELQVYAFNPRAKHVYDKLGFRYEGTRRQVLRWDGQWIDSHVMAILASEWRPVRVGRAAREF